MNTIIQDQAIGHVFDTAFGIEAASPTMRSAFDKVYGEEAAPSELGSYSFVSRSELHTIAQALQVGAGDVFADLACGTAGPGLWLSRVTGAGMLGIDASHQAIAAAKRRAAALGFEGAGRFQSGTFEDTGLPAASMDAAISLDALWLALDKPRAAAELARIVRPGGIIAITNWECDLPITGFPPQVRNHAALLECFGFETLRHEETQDWEQRQRSIYRIIRENQKEILAELGEPAGGHLVQEAHLMVGLMDGTDYLAHSRRVLYIARRRA